MPTPPLKSAPTSPSSEFARLLEATEPLKISAGEVLEATVITKSKSELWVDLSGYRTGFIPAQEIGEGARLIHDIAVGDAVYASVIVPENDEGYAILSIKRAARDRIWVDLAAKFEGKESFEGRVIEANTGGLLLDVAGVRGFLPVSQLAPEHYPRVSGGDRDLILEKLSTLVGTDLSVQVLDLNQTENKLILSEKLARTKETAASLSKYEAGQTIAGKVTGVVDFGAFISFDGLEGLIHISEIDWNRVNDPREHVQVGQELEAKIIAIEGSKVSLSLKRLQEDPWMKAASKFSEGQTVSGTVTRVTPFGAFVELDPQISGLVHVSEISEEHVENPADVLAVGDTKEFAILSIEPEGHRVALSLKSAGTEVKPRRKPSAPPDLSNVSAPVLKKLSEAGYGDIVKLKAATLEELEGIPGIGSVTAKKLKEQLA